jgi:hypothetical protein
MAQPAMTLQLPQQKIGLLRDNFMENTSGFYKEENGGLIYGPNFVLNKNYELRKETHDQHTYPVDGWYWFDSEEEALALLI